MAKRPARNEPCPCGSGKKYKRCHSQETVSAIPLSDPVTLGSLPAALRAKIDRIQSTERQRRESGYHLPHIEAEFQGKRVRAVGATIHIRPPKETFDEFLLAMAAWALGKEFIDAEMLKDEPDRHFLVRCYGKYLPWARARATETNASGDRWSAVPDGWVRSLVAFGYDIHALKHRGELPDRLMKRLRHKDQYQGARYEIAIAAMFVRVGCSVEFLDRATSDPQTRHCEFIATHGASGMQIAVEAKSRHRRGVLHMPGEGDPTKLAAGDVKGLLDEAISQAPQGMPFMIFIDINAPTGTDPGGAGHPWMQDVQDILAGYGASRVEAPDKWNMLVVSNYAFHYAGDRDSSGSEYLAVVPRYPAVALPDPRFLSVLETGLRNYGIIPRLP